MIRDFPLQLGAHHLKQRRVALGRLQMAGLVKVLSHPALHVRTEAVVLHEVVQLVHYVAERRLGRIHSRENAREGTDDESPHEGRQHHENCKHHRLRHIGRGDVAVTHRGDRDDGEVEGGRVYRTWALTHASVNVDGLHVV
eukprot:scaffold7269_cov63-Phaeocystis_antarctica.AAC.2